jgi:thiosulfate reductase cytochrome b subunit
MNQAVTRITHAAFAVAFFGLALTGTLMYLHKRWVPHGPLIHDGFGALMIVSGIVYFAYELSANGLRRVLFTSGDTGGVLPMMAYYLRLRATPPAYTGYNPLQKLAYTTVLLILAPLIAATGAALFFDVRAARIWHAGFAAELIAFFFGHMVMVLAARKGSRGTGYTLRGDIELLAPSQTCRATAHNDRRSPVSDLRNAS